MRQVYYERKTFVKYSDNEYLLYLNEEVIPDYVPENTMGDKAPDPTTAYAYTGDFGDGGTMIEAKDATYDAFVSGLVRRKYSADRVEAITLNKLSGNKERSVEFEREFKALEAYRQVCKEYAKSVLNR